MKTLTSLLMLAASAIVTPVASTSSPSTSTSSPSAPLTKEHNNLYVYAYHTGAGPNDAVLAKDVNTASSVYLDGTGTFFDFNTKLLWGVVATGDNKFTCDLGTNLINAGQGSNGFSVKGNSFMWSKPAASVDGSVRPRHHYSSPGNDSSWHFLVCDWYHKAPQLFYLNRYYDATIPSSCSKIQLKTEYIN
ncbi:unnamed protein product [Penicillium nalgiovense]|nr:unnamed protein product [Penicillium nalgiovense]